MFISIYRKYLHYFESPCSHGMAKKTWRHERIILCICDQQVSFWQIMFSPPKKIFPVRRWFQHSHLISVHHKICAIRCDNMCPAHYCLAPSEQSMFLTKSTPTGNVKPNFSPQQSYVSPTPYAPVLAHRTVHPVVPRIVAWGNKNLHTYSKLWNKDHRFEGLLRFKKPNISWKLFSFRAGFYQVLWSYASLCTFETVLSPALKYSLMLGENRCLYISGRKNSTNNQTAEYNENDENTTAKDLQPRAISELKIGCSLKDCVTKRLWYILPVFFCA